MSGCGRCSALCNAGNPMGQNPREVGDCGFLQREGRLAAGAEQASNPPVFEDIFNGASDGPSVGSFNQSSCATHDDDNFNQGHCSSHSDDDSYKQGSCATPDDEKQ